MLAGESSLSQVIACVESYKSQTYPYKELIIINNSSSQYKASELAIHAQHNVFVLDTPIKLSAGMARNHGIAAANGRILAQFDSNYFHHPNRLESQVAALAESEAEVCYLTSTLKYSFVSGRATRNTNDKSVIPQSLVMIRSKGVDYPNEEKGEEKSLMTKLINQKKVVSINAPMLMTKVCLGRSKIIDNPLSYADLTHDEKIVIMTMLNNQKTFANI